MCGSTTETPLKASLPKRLSNQRSAKSAIKRGEKEHLAAGPRLRCLAAMEKKGILSGWLSLKEPQPLPKKREKNKRRSPLVAAALPKKSRKKRGGVRWLPLGRRAATPFRPSRRSGDRAERLGHGRGVGAELHRPALEALGLLLRDARAREARATKRWQNPGGAQVNVPKWHGKWNQRRKPAQP